MLLNPFIVGGKRSGTSRKEPPGTQRQIILLELMPTEHHMTILQAGQLSSAQKLSTNISFQLEIKLSGRSQARPKFKQFLMHLQISLALQTNRHHIQLPRGIEDRVLTRIHGLGWQTQEVFMEKIVTLE